MSPKRFSTGSVVHLAPLDVVLQSRFYNARTNDVYGIDLKSYENFVGCGLFVARESAHINDHPAKEYKGDFYSCKLETNGLPVFWMPAELLVKAAGQARVEPLF